MFHLVRGNDVIAEYDVALFPLLSQQNRPFSVENIKNGKNMYGLIFQL